MNVKLYTVPNMLSIYRFLSALFIFAAIFIDIDKWIVFVVYVIAVITDKLDGMLARKLNQVSKIGELLETSVDTVLTGFILVYLIKHFDFPVMIFFGMFALFLVAILNMTIYFIFKKKWYTRSLVTSKVSVVVTYLVGVVYFFEFSFNENLAAIMLIVAAVAFVYFQYKLVRDLMINKKNI